jgi:hypothetical protein
VSGGVQLGPLGIPATNRPIVPTPGDYDDGEIGVIIGRETRSTRGKPASVPLCPPQMTHAARNRTRAAAVESQRLTTWATARLKYNKDFTVWIFVSKNGYSDYKHCDRFCWYHHVDRYQHLENYAASIFIVENWGNMFLHNIGIYLQNYMSSHPRIWTIIIIIIIIVLGKQPFLSQNLP